MDSPHLKTRCVKRSFLVMMNCYSVRSFIIKYYLILFIHTVFVDTNLPVPSKPNYNVLKCTLNNNFLFINCTATGFSSHLHCNMSWNFLSGQLFRE